MMRLLLLACAWSAMADAVDSAMLFPRVGVAIADADVLRGQRLKPVLLTADAGQLYFSSQSETKDCVGQGLYRIALAKVNALTVEPLALRRDGQPLTEPLCVQRLQTSGGLVLVHHLWKSQWQIDRVVNGELSPFLADGPELKLHGLWRWKLHQLRTQVPEFDKAIWRAVDIQPQRVRLAGYLPGEKTPRYTTLSLKSGDPAEHLELRSFAEFSPEPLAQLDFMGEDGLVGISQPADFRSFATVYVGLMSEGRATSYGGNRPYLQDTVWDELPAADWSVRRLSAVSVQANGFYLADATTFANEYPLLAYFDFSLQTLFRVAGLNESWNKQLKAVAPWHGGLLLAYREPPLIAFVGEQNPFPETLSPTRKPDLQEISETDYLKLLEEVKHAKRD